MKALVTLLLAVAAVAGCGDDAEKPAKRPARDRLPVVYEHGGGIAAQPRTLEIDREGHAKLMVVTGGKRDSRTFDLTPAQLGDLRAALDAAAGVRGPGESYCADCYTFDIKADGVDVTLDEALIGDGKAPEELSDLVTLLERLSQP